MHGVAADAMAPRDWSVAATCSNGHVPQLEEARADSGDESDTGKQLCRREEDPEEGNHTLLVPRALEQSRTLNAMISQFVLQRSVLLPQKKLRRGSGARVRNSTR